MKRSLWGICWKEVKFLIFVVYVFIWLGTNMLYVICSFIRLIDLCFSFYCLKFHSIKNILYITSLFYLEGRKKDLCIECIYTFTLVDNTTASSIHASRKYPTSLVGPTSSGSISLMKEHITYNIFVPNQMKT
jgi:hypothetical protein